jgi:hypothetical protein
MSAGFAFHPEFLPRTTPEMRFAAIDRFLQRRAVHPCHHQHASRLLFLDDRRNQTVGVEFQIFEKAHAQTRRILLNCTRQTTKKDMVFPGVQDRILRCLGSDLINTPLQRGEPCATTQKPF